jgi:LDH2 family malate/lactate/ureidoglycolate dehydrogenase
MADGMPRVAAAIVRAQIEAILTAWGMDAEKIRVTAEVIVETDLMGIDSHGVSMLLQYWEMQRAGQLQLRAEPRIVRQTASTALVDGGAGLGHPVSVFAMELAIEKAAAHDVGVVSVFNSHHHGAVGYYAEMAARRGLLSMVASSTRVVAVVPTRGGERALGTNPFAFAAPAGRHPPVVLDIATSVVAVNKVKVYALKGLEMPAGWVVDGEGRPMTDARAAYELLVRGTAGGLVPIGGGDGETGGHKGYGLGLFAQIFASTLGGGSFSPIRKRSQRPDEPDNIGHFFMVLNPAAFRPPGDFEADLDAVIDDLKGLRPAVPGRPVLLPGDPERAARAEREAQGIPMAPALCDRIREIADASGAPYLLGV